MVLVLVHRGRIPSIKEIKELEEGLCPDALVDAEGFCDAQVHIRKMRRCERVAARFQVPAIEVLVAVLIEGHERALRVVKTALRSDEAAELNLPRKLYEPMRFEGMAQGKI